MKFIITNKPEQYLEKKTCFFGNYGMDLDIVHVLVIDYDMLSAREKLAAFADQYSPMPYSNLNVEKALGFCSTIKIRNEGDVKFSDFVGRCNVGAIYIWSKSAKCWFPT